MNRDLFRWNESRDFNRFYFYYGDTQIGEIDGEGDAVITSCFLTGEEIVSKTSTIKDCRTWIEVTVDRAIEKTGLDPIHILNQKRSKELIKEKMKYQKRIKEIDAELNLIKN